MIEDPAGDQRRLHDAARGHLAIIKGWTQLLLRESIKPTPDLARMTRMAHAIEASIAALEQEPRRREVDTVVDTVTKQ